MARKEKKNNSFLLQGGILAIASVLVRIIGLIYRIPLTRILGESGIGFYSTAFEVYSLGLVLSSFSLPIAVSKLVAARLATKDRRNAHEILKCALLFASVVGFVVAIIIYFGAGFISDKIMGSYLSIYALRVLAPGLFIVALLGVIRGYFQGYGTMIPTAVSQVLEQIVNAIVSIVAAYSLYAYGKTAVQGKSIKNKNLIPAAYGAAGGTLGTVLGALFALVFLGLLYFAFCKANRNKLKKNKTNKLESKRVLFPILLMTILPIVLSSIMTNICNTLDIIIFNNAMKYQGMEYKTYSSLWGIFTGKISTLTTVPITLAYAIGTSVIPALSSAIVLGRKNEINSKIEASIRLSMLVVIPSFMGYAFLASPILRLLFNDGKSNSAYMLITGSFMIMFYALFAIQGTILQGLGNLKAPVKNAIISLGIHIVSLIIMLFAFRMNIYAVIASNIIFAICMCYLNQKDIYKISNYVQEYKETFFMPITAALAMGIVARIVYFIISSIIGNIIGVAFAIMSGACVYLIVLLKTKLIKENDILMIPMGTKAIEILQRLNLL